MSRSLLSFLLFIFVGSSLYAQRCISLPLNFVDGKPIVQAELNGHLVYLLLDTGSDLTILDTRAARRFGFRTHPLPHRNKQIKGIGHNSPTLEVALGVDLRVSGQPIFTTFISTSLNKVDPRFRTSGRTPLIGIIGADLMEQYGFVMDYEGGWVQMNFGAPADENTQIILTASE